VSVHTPATEPHLGHVISSQWLEIAFKRFEFSLHSGSIEMEINNLLILSALGYILI